MLNEKLTSRYILLITAEVRLEAEVRSSECKNNSDLFSIDQFARQKQMSMRISR